MKKKLSLADIKSGILIDTPEKITVEILVNGEPCDFETHIKIMDYSTAIAQMEANQKNKEALASILAQLVLPVPRVPVNRYAWPMCPVATWFFSAAVIASCPYTSPKVFGRYLRYKA